MLSINYTPDQLVKLTGGVYHQKAFEEKKIKDVLIDSRRLVNPEHCLFVALKTRKNDGHNYVAELYTKGVRNYILNHIPDNAQDMPNANIILVKDTLKALQKIGEYHRKQFDIPVIGITGSNGKTIIKEWLYQLLQNDYNIVRSPKSYNSQVGVALSALQMSEDNNLAIFEAGISETDEMERLQAIIRPTIGIFTNIGPAHNENFINISQKVGEKLKLFTAVDTLIYSSDHYEIREQIIKSELAHKINIFKWSKNPDSDLVIQEISRNQRQTIIQGRYQDQDVKIIIPFTDQASIENAIHCWMTMLLLNYDNDTINERIQSLSPVAMRLELKEGINHCSVINDSYNSDFNALVIALDFMNQQKQHQKKTVILSDILQSGMNNLNLYQSVYELLKEKQIDRLIGIGKNIRQQSNQFQDMDAEFYASTDDFLNKFSIASFNNETILLKGARMFEFERINKVLQQQSHETVLEINLNALIDNYNYFRSVVKPDTKIMAMVKAFSYGSGSFEIANILQYHRVDYLGVAYTDEGVELRKSGITLPLMVMNPEEHSFDIMIRHNLEPEIYSFRVLELLDKAIERNIVQDQRPVGIHLKLDTGMRRLGFTYDEVDEVISKIQNNPLIRINSVFSHLAASDEPDETDFTQNQIESFEKMASKIQRHFEYEITRHISNSAAITRYPNAQLDMVRLGIGLYGVATDPGIKSKLRNVSRLKTSISQIKYINKDETVGYSRAFKAETDMKIGIVPIGYADGLSRILSNKKGRLWVKGQAAPIVGNICMDMCMVDLNGLEVEEGDEVVVFDDQHTIEEMANDLGTIPYEVLTNVSRRVKRVYYHEG
ncbi:MAG: bifunctional UDP-N-acetylmuramoyl-tripeptide:D-alanyl-D-alanine ligase/alanine racemase [Bacteroidales bacterium]